MPQKMDLEDLSFAQRFWQREEYRQRCLRRGVGGKSKIICFGNSSMENGLIEKVSNGNRWELELAEGPCRVRCKLVPNHKFFDSYDVSVRIEETDDGSVNSTAQPTFAKNTSDSFLEVAELESLLKGMSKLGLASRRSINDGSCVSPRQGSSLYISVFEDEEFEEYCETGSAVTSVKYNSDRPDTMDFYEQNTGNDGDEAENFAIKSPMSVESGSTGIETTDPDPGTSNSTSVMEHNEDEQFANDVTNGSSEPSEPIERFARIGYDESLLDYEIVLGLIDSDDWPIEAAFNVTRCIGLDTQKAVMIVATNAAVLVTGFEIEGVKGGIIGSKIPPQPKGERIDRGRLIKSLRRCDENYDLNNERVKVRLREESWNERDFSSKYMELPVVQKKELFLERELSDCRDDVTLRDLLSGVNAMSIKCDEISAVYKRCYELRDVALEIFDVSGRSALIAFETTSVQEDALSLFLTKELPRSVFASSKSKIKLPVSGGLAGVKNAYKRFILDKKSEATRKWQEGSISNFEYLMELNTLAGRTFNDITQYPVFPWVIADYSSKQIDLNDPRTFRDLSKPMGAIGEERSAQFKERYESVLESVRDGGGECDPPPFHYGTHYSCAGYVLHYLVRLEPYSRMALSLQGGQFDKPDRLFRDVKSSWESSSSENLQDVRELIPEFYYLPEFLQNMNNFDLGITQRNIPVGDVGLPPWANNSAREFVRVMRKALESDYVSNNLHLWIDLVFGYKQRGEEAVKAQNVFVHLTYEGQVDIDAIKDPMLREATLAQIRNFGLTPTKLFKRLHVRKNIPKVVRTDDKGNLSADLNAINWHSTLTPPLCIVGLPNIAAMKPVATLVTTLGSSLSDSTAINDAKLIKDRIIITNKKCVLYSSMYGEEYIKYGTPNCGISFYQTGLSSSNLTQPEQLISSHDSLHFKPVSCVATIEAGTVIATGSEDGVVRVWKVSQCLKTGSLLKVLNEVETLNAHEGPVSCIDMCEGFQLLVTGGKADDRVFVWDLNTLALTRELPGHKGEIEAISINLSVGSILTLSSATLRIFGINGDLVGHCCASALRKSVPTTAVATKNQHWQEGIVAVTGHNNGDLSLWGIDWENSSKLVCRRVLNGIQNKPITCVRVSGDQRNVIAGDSNGKVTRWQCLRLGDLSSAELLDLTTA